MSGRVRYEDARGTLAGMFPLLDLQLIDDVLVANQGHLERTVDYLLEISPAAAASQASAALSGGERERGNERVGGREGRRQRDRNVSGMGERKNERGNGMGSGGGQDANIAADEEYARMLQYQLFEGSDVYMPELESAFRNEPEVLAFLSEQREALGRRNGTGHGGNESLPLSSLLSSAQGAIRSSLMSFFSSRDDSPSSPAQRIPTTMATATEARHDEPADTRASVVESIDSAGKSVNVYQAAAQAANKLHRRRQPAQSPAYD
mmetsp:Transcript_13292/g.52975  ORF Transcript_13292/g.52975 Transcript_13292/m.52975 type:complete len:264 (-) Transcript_13292:49-840(-)